MSNITDNHTRFKDLPWFNKVTAHYVSVLGAGGIGSWYYLFSIRANIPTLIVDFDIVEEHNIGGQLYSIEDVGSSKVSSIVSFVNKYAPSSNLKVFFNDVVNEENVSSYTSIYTISCFDNMKARKLVFDSWKNSYGNNPNAIFIDGRLNAEMYQIFCVKGESVKDIEEYEREHLFDDSLVEDLPCTMKQTSHVAAMIAGTMFSFFTNHITNTLDGSEEREVPFKTEYFIPLNLFSTS